MSNVLLRRLSWAVAAAVVAAPGLGQAEALKDLQVLGRALGFLENGPTGRATIGILFDPAKPASVAEKDQVIQALGSGVNIGGLTVVGAPVPVSALGAAGALSAIYVTEGVNYAAVGPVAKSKKLLTMSSGSACVTSGACVMGVVSSPKVEITVNRATAAAVGVSFKAAFRLMIKEI